jgi:hypothetical protein
VLPKLVLEVEFRLLLESVVLFELAQSFDKKLTLVMGDLTKIVLNRWYIISVMPKRQPDAKNLFLDNHLHPAAG